MGISRGTNLSAYTQLWGAFAISGLFHANSIRILPTPENVTFKEQTAGIFFFFLFQAAAITFEDIIKWLWCQVVKRKGFKTSKRLTVIIGYSWTFFVIWKTLPLAGDVFLRMRIGQDPLFPISVAAPFVKMLPIPPT